MVGLPSAGRTAFPAVRHALALKSYANLSRRVEWSNSSVIFSPHASEPRILARHFSSSKHFNIPTPTPILSQPDAFDPPTVISLAPGDVHLFAYFPPGQRYSNGTACLWKRGQEIDNWTIDHSWTIAPSAGIIAASWLGSPREVRFNSCVRTDTNTRNKWVANDQAEFVRLPRRGPATPVSDPTLLLVSQNHRATLCYMRQSAEKLKMVSVSLSYHNSTAETKSPPDLDRDNVNVLRICSTAAIGLAYDGISSHSRYLYSYLDQPQRLQSLLLRALMSYLTPLRITISPTTKWNWD